MQAAAREAVEKALAAKAAARMATEGIGGGGSSSSGAEAAAAAVSLDPREVQVRPLFPRVGEWVTWI